MAKNGQVKPKLKYSKIEQSPKQIDQKNNIWDLFKFGESYTSLVLGIIVVIVATITLITFVKGKDNITRLTNVSNNVVSVKTGGGQTTPTSGDKQNLLNNEQKNTTPTKSAEPTAKPTIKPTNIKAKPTEAKKIAAKKNNTNNNNKQQTMSGTTYTVVAGDTLWGIAEKKFKSGYNWVDIQKANKIANADKLSVGQKLTIPNVKSKIATSNKSTQTTVSNTQTNKIESNNYTVVKGDTLWDISVRAYGDGFVWSKIASANKLNNPSVIHAGNKLSIPRG